MALKTGAKATSRERLVSAKQYAIHKDAAPAEFLWRPNQLNMWGNATFGDCVTAEECFAKACNSPEVFIPSRKAIKWARKNFVLNGAGIWEVLELMQTSGFDYDGVTYNDGAFQSVAWNNASILHAAIVEGPVKLGVQSDELINVPGIGFNGNGWFATGFVGGNPQDHCTSLCGYGTFNWLAAQLGVTVPGNLDGNTPGYAMFTWSTIGIIDMPSLQAIVGEAWLRTPTTVQVKDA